MMNEIALPRFRAHLPQPVSPSAVQRQIIIRPAADTFELRFGDKTASPEYNRGLAGVIADKTAISRVLPTGESLIYRGYDIKDLMQGSFEETAYLLLKGKLPNRGELANFTTALRRQRPVSPAVLDLLKQSAWVFHENTHPMDKLAYAVRLVGNTMDPAWLMRNDNKRVNYNKAITLMAKMPTLVAAIHRIEQGQEPIAPDGSLPMAENFLYMLTGEKPDPQVARVFDKTLIAYGDHDFNASTTAGRVTASTQSDMVSALISAIGTLKGPLHGGANEKVMNMFLEIGSVDQVEPYIMKALAEKRRLPGFGHREYDTRNGDPRARILLEMAEDLVKRTGETKWHEMAVKAMAVMDREIGKKNERRVALGQPEKYLPPNVDFPIAYIYHMLGIPTKLYTPIFAMARTAGWTSHVVELYSDPVLYRPKADYRGKPEGQIYTAMSER